MTSKHYRPPVNSSEFLVVFAFPVTQFAVVSYSLKYAVTHRVTSRKIVIGVLVFYAYSFLSSTGYPNIEEFLLTCFCTRLFRTLSYHFIIHCFHHISLLSGRWLLQKCSRTESVYILRKLTKDTYSNNFPDNCSYTFLYEKPQPSDVVRGRLPLCWCKKAL